LADDSAVQVQLIRSLRLLTACLPVHRLQPAVFMLPDGIDEPDDLYVSQADRERQLQRRHTSRISPDAPRLSRSPLDIPGHLLNADCPALSYVLVPAFPATSQPQVLIRVCLHSSCDRPVVLSSEFGHCIDGPARSLPHLDCVVFSSPLHKPRSSSHLQPVSILILCNSLQIKRIAALLQLTKLRIAHSALRGSWHYLTHKSPSI